MLYRLAILATLLVLPLQALKIGNVEFQLPASQQDWVETPINLGSDEITSILLLPPNTSKNEAKESYNALSVHLENFDVENFNLKAFTEGLEAQFPNAKVEASLLEKWPKSVLYEFTAGNDEHGVHALVRIFATNEKCVFLQYTAPKGSLLEEKRQVVMGALKSATSI